MKDSPSTKVLVISGHPDRGHMVAKWLRADGLEHDLASDAKQAVSLIKSGCYPVVVSDVAMPDLIGPDLLALVNTLSSDVSAIIMATDSEADLARTCMALGAYASITEPFNKSQLMIQIKGALELHRALAPLLADPSDVAEQTPLGGLQEFPDLKDFHSREEEVVLRLLACQGLRNGENPSHLRRVGELSSLLARTLGWEHERG